MSDMVAIVPNQEVLTSGIGVVGDFFMNPPTPGALVSRYVKDGTVSCVV